MEQITVKAREQARVIRSINRALGDLRRGVPVAIVDNDRALLILSCEQLNAGNISEIEGLSDAKAAIFITENRAHGLKLHAPGPVVALSWPKWLGIDDVAALADPSLDLAHPFKGPFEPLEDLSREKTALAAVEIVKHAQLLPAAVGVPANRAVLNDADILCVTVDDVLNYQSTIGGALTALVDAHVPLRGAENARIYVFRPEDGGVEHLAIVVGDPPRKHPVLARLHSECLTGDILGSLKCDCGDQLHGALSAISDAGGGVLLYLAQEGRGIGLANKLRAYKLQDQGFDTVDANLRLGFGVDERLFAPAATILKKLGFSQVRLMTNNPQKVEALRQYGINIVERVAHQFPSNVHNEGYLETKGRRTGHMLKDI